MDGIGKQEATPWAAVEGQLLLGQRRWVGRQKRRLKGVSVAPEVTGQKRLRVRPSLSVVITQVCRAARVDKKTLLRPRGARGTWARRVAMALAWEVCGLTQREVGQAFGVGPYAVGKAAARSANFTAINARVGRMVGRLKSNVQR